MIPTFAAKARAVREDLDASREIFVRGAAKRSSNSATHGET
jgi:hypothetical protein